jgi:hypothetical protein
MPTTLRRRRLRSSSARAYCRRSPPRGRRVGRRDDLLSLTWYAEELVGLDGALVLFGMGGNAVGRRMARGLAGFVRDLSARDVLAGVAIGPFVTMALPAAGHQALDRAITAASRVAAVAGKGTALISREVVVSHVQRTAALHAASVELDRRPLLAQRLAAPWPWPIALVLRKISRYSCRLMPERPPRQTPVRRLYPMAVDGSSGCRNCRVDVNSRRLGISANSETFVVAEAQ